MPSQARVGMPWRGRRNAQGSAARNGNARIGAKRLRRFTRQHTVQRRSGFLCARPVLPAGIAARVQQPRNPTGHHQSAPLPQADAAHEPLCCGEQLRRRWPSVQVQADQPGWTSGQQSGSARHHLGELAPICFADKASCAPVRATTPRSDPDSLAMQVWCDRAGEPRH